MNQKIQIIISAASVLAFSAMANDAPKIKTDGPNPDRDTAFHARRQSRLNDAAKASDIIGMTVQNKQGEKLGKVKDLAVDVESGRIVQVILSTGGFAGIDSTLTSVPPEALHADAFRKVLCLDADTGKLKDAPRFAMSKWAECSDSNHLSAVYSYYGEEPGLRFIQSENAEPSTVSTRNADGTWAKDATSCESQCMIPSSRLSKAHRASKLIGETVKNPQNEKLGTVKNILLDLPSGRIVAVIISSGGFLGINGELSAVPPAALQCTKDRNVLQLEAAKDTFANAPHFKANQWPDFAQPANTAEVYRDYNVQPYFASYKTTEPDNTTLNVRDRNDQTLTPLNQGNSQSDVSTTARIRKEIIASKDMSVDARNVKIITVDGQVTLRGPVDTADEKSLINDIAINIARLENVHNQIEVKQSAPQP